MGTAIAVDSRLTGMKPVYAVAPGLWPSRTKFETKHNEKQYLDVQSVLNSTGVARKVLELKSRTTVFTQGDPATSVMYIQEGAVKLTVINESGNQAVAAILGRGDFLGEGCLVGQLQRVSTASTIAPSTILVIEKPQMIRLLHTDGAFRDRFMADVISRNMQIEADLVSQLFNPVEKRLARMLLLMAHSGSLDRSADMFPEISQEMLAEMIGATRSRVNSFMNKFRRLGFIEYGISLRGLKVNESLQAVLEDAESRSERIASYRPSRFDRKKDRTQNSEFSYELHGAAKH